MNLSLEKNIQIVFLESFPAKFFREHLFKRKKLDLFRRFSSAPEFVQRPCKIWAPYSGHCVEKKSSTQIQICYHPKTRLKILSWSYLSNSVRHLIWYFPFVLVKKCFYVLKQSKTCIVWGQKNSNEKHQMLGGLLLAL